MGWSGGQPWYRSHTVMTSRNMMPVTAYEINDLGKEEQVNLLRMLIPERLFEIFHVDREYFTNRAGQKIVKFICPEKMPFFQIEFWRALDERDPVMFLDISTTSFGQMEISFIVVNDPGAERFEIDVDEKGQDTYFGTVRRNISEEEKSLEAGLAPGQVRKGLRLMRYLVQTWEIFFSRLGHKYFFLEPLGYYSAILYEKYGFDYIKGKEKMLYIDREFRKGGVLWARLDGSTPFRERSMAETVRGRAWAIHDGILDEPWVSPKMYKTIGYDSKVCTFKEYTF